MQNVGFHATMTAKKFQMKRNNFNIEVQSKCMKISSVEYQKDFGCLLVISINILICALQMRTYQKISLLIITYFQILHIFVYLFRHELCDSRVCLMQQCDNEILRLNICRNDITHFSIVIIINFEHTYTTKSKRLAAHRTSSSE